MEHRHDMMRIILSVAAAMLSRGHPSVIQDVQHSDAAARIDPAEAAAVVAEQWTQQAELNLGASSTYLQLPGLLLRLILLQFTRNPIEFHTLPGCAEAS